MSRTFDEVIEYLQERRKKMLESANDSPLGRHWSLRAIEDEQIIINLRSLQKRGKIDRPEPAPWKMKKS